MKLFSQDSKNSILKGIKTGINSLSRLKINKVLINRVIVIVCSITLVYSLYNIFVYYYDSFRNKSLIDNVQDIFYNRRQYEPHKVDDDDFNALLRSIVLNEAKASAPDKDDTGKNKEILDKYIPLLEINKDVVGWINVPNTRIDYPVLQYTDNEYYLDKTIDLEKNKAGSIFMDFRNRGDGSDRHTIIYGHHMRDGSMFKGLVRFEDEEFFRSNGIIEFNTLYEDIKWQIFSVYVTGTNFNYLKTTFNTPDEYKTFLATIKGKSEFATDVEVTENDQILTLSTCTYDYSEARLVVHAKRLK